ncbi:hypothetical protein D5086_015811 [Populus alba]|uniref:Uncharacterized protein n=1 Tax=Populus alba TaxID=43335 RepID=A0ACC4BSJ7_POPAL
MEGGEGSPELRANPSAALNPDNAEPSCQSLNSNAIQLMARAPKMTQHRLPTDPITRNSTIVSTKGPALGFVINENVLPSSDL